MGKYFHKFLAVMIAFEVVAKSAGISMSKKDIGSPMGPRNSENVVYSSVPSMRRPSPPPTTTSGPVKISESLPPPPPPPPPPPLPEKFDPPEILYFYDPYADNIYAVDKELGKFDTIPRNPRKNVYLTDSKEALTPRYELVYEPNYGYVMIPFIMEQQPISGGKNSRPRNGGRKNKLERSTKATIPAHSPISVNEEVEDTSWKFPGKLLGEIRGSNPGRGRRNSGGSFSQERFRFSPGGYYWGDEDDVDLA